MEITRNTLSDWDIEVIFINDYAETFDKDEQKERKDSEYRFYLAIRQVIEETGIVPAIGSWIEPLYKPDYVLDIGAIKGVDFYPARRIIRFEIE